MVRNLNTKAHYSEEDIFKNATWIKTPRGETFYTFYTLENKENFLTKWQEGQIFYRSSTVLWEEKSRGFQRLDTRK